MQVRGTRGGDATDLLQALEEGLGPDGGLYLPVEWPRLPDPPGDLGDTAADTAAWAAPLLLKGLLPAEELAALAREALDFPIPLRDLDGRIRLLELFHGPTLAFKDVGARFLARAWSRAGGEGTRTVLVATSGDTGGAVAAACHGVPGVQVAVLFPAGRVSELQRRQFTTLGGNVLAIAVDGPFDRCQHLVREALSDPGAREYFHLTSANSINLGRLLPQVFYYLHLARLQGWGRGEVTRTPVLVPSGNLGNVTAGVLAARTGAPLGPLVAACNANDVLVRYQRDGETREAPVTRTLSTAMDVGAPSNLERLIYLFGNDPAQLREGLPALSIPDSEVEATIRWGWESAGVHLDPHTAVGVAAARREPWATGPVTVLATAHPAKFPEVVGEAAGVPVPPHRTLEGARELPERITPLTGSYGQLVEILERAFLVRDPRLR